MTNSVIWLQNWYKSQCDGDWEHTYGIKIETIDNPGWWISIDLVETELENVAFNSLEVERSEDNWFFCMVKDNKFQGAGGFNNLTEILETFQTWVIVNT